MERKHIESFAKYAGFATVSVEWLALILYYIQLPDYFGGQYPISYYASLPQTKLIFSTCYTLAGIFFWIFVRHHLHKHYKAPLEIFTLSLILFVCLAIIPFDPNNFMSKNIHTTLGMSSALLFTIGMYKLAKDANNKIVSLVTAIAITLSVAFFIAFFISPKDSHLIFAFEAGSWLIIQIWVIWISIYSHKLLL